MRGRLLWVAGAAIAAAWCSRANLGLDAQTIAPASDTAPAPFVTSGEPAAVPILRDPFAGAARDDGPAAAVSQLDSGGPIVPNIDTANAPLAASPAVVRATIVGPNPVAYIDDGTGVQLARVGDVVGGRNVAAIDLQGVTFGDGTRAELIETAPTDLPARPQATAATPHTPAAGVRRATATVRVRVPASPPAAEPFPTPAPLRTVDPRGLPPGANPTPDALGPTPLPYVFPYAPPRRTEGP